MSNENERIDIEAYTQIFGADDGITDEQLVAFGLSALAELKRCYRYMDSMNEELANWRRVIEIFDPHSSYPELSAAMAEAFGYEH